MRYVIVPLTLFAALAAQPEVDEPSSDNSCVYEGVIEPFRVVQLSCAVDGVLETVTVERGDLVQAGQVIATLESSVEESTLELAKARAELVGTLEKRQARRDHVALRLDHDDKLFEKGILSAETHDQTKTEKRLADAECVEAEESLRLAKLDKLRAEAALELRTIRSSISGVVTKRYLSPGELVTRQDHSKIVEIAQVRPLRAEVILPASKFGTIAVGMKAEVEPEADSHTEVLAKVITVDRTIEAASNTFRVGLELPNSDNSLTAGLKCKVRFLDQQPTVALDEQPPGAEKE